MKPVSLLSSTLLADTLSDRYIVLQAGLPLDMFWAVHDPNDALPSEDIVVVGAANVTLARAGTRSR